MSHKPEPAPDSRPLVDEAAELRDVLRRIGVSPMLRPAEGPPVLAPLVASRPSEVSELTDVDVAPLADDAVAPVLVALDGAAATVADEDDEPQTVARIQVGRPIMRVVEAAADAAPEPTVEAAEGPPPAPLAPGSAVEISLHGATCGHLAIFARYLSLQRFAEDWTEHLQWGTWTVKLPWRFAFPAGTSFEIVLQPPDAPAAHLEGRLLSVADGLSTFEVEVPPETYLALAALAE